MGVAGLTAAACSDETEGETDGSGGDGAGGATTTTPTTAGGTGGTPDIPIECPSGDYTTIPTVGECDLLQNDCPPGFGCEPVTDGDWTTGCVAGNGLKGPGQPCVSAGDCKPGSECVFDVCAPVCCPDNDEPCEGGLCNVVNQFGDYLVRYCSYLAQCDLFDPNQCDDGVLGRRRRRANPPKISGSLPQHHAPATLGTRAPPPAPPRWAMAKLAKTSMIASPTCGAAAEPRAATLA